MPSATLLFILTLLVQNANSHMSGDWLVPECGPPWTYAGDGSAFSWWQLFLLLVLASSQPFFDGKLMIIKVIMMMLEIPLAKPSGIVYHEYNSHCKFPSVMAKLCSLPPFA